MTNKQAAKTLRAAASALEHGRSTTAIKKLNAAFSGLDHLLKKDSLPAMPVLDGEPTNEQRGLWALRALTQFANDTSGGEMDNAVADFLGDLMHLCNLDLVTDETGNKIILDFDNELERGRQFFQEELDEEQAQWTEADNANS